MNTLEKMKAYIIGGGISGLATAVFLIKDGGMKGGDITIFEHAPKSGGSLDGEGSAEKGYLSRGYRMFEKSIYLSMYDLLSKIPSLKSSGKTLKDDFFEFNERIKINAGARLVKNGEIIDAHRMGLSWRDRFRLIKLLFLPESFFGVTQIDSYFTSDFFKSNFWFEWSTVFTFEHWHSLVEMKRYLERFIQDALKLDTMSCVLSAPYSEFDFIILPILKFLEKSGVVFEQNHTVTDIEFEQNENKNKKMVIGILLKEKKDKINIKPEDFVFLVNGSITADSSVGSMDKAPLYVESQSIFWDVWIKISKKFSDLGNPHAFYNSIRKSKWESFTVTFKNYDFFDFVEKFSGNKAGTGGLITFKDSNWLISLGLPHQPYFTNQPDGTFVCWGYGLFSDRHGNHINKRMSECSGREILEELCFHIGLKDRAQKIIENAICIPVVMPYITSQFSPRKKSDRPLVVPKGSQNFACIGQYVEIPNEIVFTVECSVRSAKIAVKKLLNLSVKIPPLYQRQYNPVVIFNAVRTILR